LDAFSRVAAATILDTLAFVAWQVSSRSPVRVVEDALRSLRNGRDFVAGVASAVIGAGCVVAAVLLLFPALPDPPRDFATFELATLLVALGLDFLIGDDLRRLLPRRRRS
jgi:hypothetical protein